MSAPVEVRAAAPADAAKVAALGARLFVQAYGATHPEPELTPYVRRTHSAAADRAAAERGADAFWLDVWSEAARAVRFYERAGVVVLGATTFAWGERRDADHVMARAVHA